MSSQWCSYRLSCIYRMLGEITEVQLRKILAIRYYRLYPPLDLLGTMNKLWEILSRVCIEILSGALRSVGRWVWSVVSKDEKFPELHNLQMRHHPINPWKFILGNHLDDTEQTSLTTDCTTSEHAFGCTVKILNRKSMNYSAEFLLQLTSGVPGVSGTGCGL